VHSYSSDTTLNTFHRVKIADPAKWEELPGGKHLQGLALVEHKGQVIRIGGMEPKHKAGEKSDISSTASVQSYDPKAKKWSDLPDMPAPRSSHDAAVVGDTLVVVGGWNMSAGKESEWATDTLTLNLADPKAKWVAVKQPFVRRALSVAALDGKVYAVGGMGEDSNTDHSVNVFDPKTGKWADAPKLPGDRMNAFTPAVIASGGKLYANPADGKVYRLNGDKWEDVSAVKAARYVHRMVPLPDGKLLVLGGASKDGPRASCEVVGMK
jgi:N-acetylneuraminic acid mutarotase